MKEYFLFDPDQEYLEPPLQGHRLAGDAYAPIALDETGALVSEELGLKLQFENGVLQLYRIDTGERLLTGDERAAEEAAARQAEAAARQAEAAARQTAEAELARLREQMARRSEA